MQAKIFKSLISKNLLTLFQGYEVAKPRHIFIPDRKKRGQLRSCFISDSARSWLFGHIYNSYLVTSECGGPLCRFLRNILSVFLLHALLVLYLGVQVFQCDIKKLQLCNGWKAGHIFFFQNSLSFGFYKRGQYHYSN